MREGKTIEDALYDDCETDLERSEFFESGRAHETGVVAKVIEKDVAKAFFAKHLNGQPNCEHGFIGMDASFIHEPNEGSWPIVTVRFALNDWKARDAFMKHFGW